MGSERASTIGQGTACASARRARQAAMRARVAPPVTGEHGGLEERGPVARHAQREPGDADDHRARRGAVAHAAPAEGRSRAETPLHAFTHTTRSLGAMTLGAMTALTASEVQMEPLFTITGG